MFLPLIATPTPQLPEEPGWRVQGGQEGKIEGMAGNAFQAAVVPLEVVPPWLVAELAPPCVPDGWCTLCSRPVRHQVPGAWRTCHSPSCDDVRSPIRKELLKPAQTHKILP